jgi:hypothetical protein
MAQLLIDFEPARQQSGKPKVKRATRKPSVQLSAVDSSSHWSTSFMVFDHEAIAAERLHGHRIGGRS